MIIGDQCFLNTGSDSNRNCWIRIRHSGGSRKISVSIQQLNKLTKWTFHDWRVWPGWVRGTGWPTGCGLFSGNSRSSQHQINPVKDRLLLFWKIYNAELKKITKNMNILREQNLLMPIRIYSFLNATTLKQKKINHNKQTL